MIRVKTKTTLRALGQSSVSAAGGRLVASDGRLTAADGRLAAAGTHLRLLRAEGERPSTQIVL